MTKRVYSLKHATPRMKYVHMNAMTAWSDNLKEHQANEAARKRIAMITETCQQVRDLMTQEQYDAWWESAPEDHFLEAAQTKLKELQSAPKLDRAYNGKQLPTPCPKCGGNLFVNERKMRIRGSAPHLSYFVGCANFQTRGCNYGRSLTVEDKTAIDSVVHDETPEF